MNGPYTDGKKPYVPFKLKKREPAATVAKILQSMRTMMETDNDFRPTKYVLLIDVCIDILEREVPGEDQKSE